MRNVNRRSMLSAAAAGLLAATAAAGPAAAQATAQVAANDPAAVKVGQFYNVLLASMKQGKQLGFSGRVQKLTPAVESAFNLPYMTFLVTGPAWNSMSAADKASIQAAFTRYTVASYAHNFDSFDGQKLIIDPAVQTRGLDKLVKTQITSTGDSPVNLSYRLRQSGGAWKIIDVNYNSISQLTTQRSDFSSALQSGGAKALVAKLDGLTAKLK